METKREGANQYMSDLGVNKPPGDTSTPLKHPRNHIGYDLVLPNIKVPS